MKHALLDYVIEVLGVKNDAALARALHVTPPLICKLRYGLIKPGAGIILRMHFATGLPVRTLKGVANLPCLPIGGRR